MRLSNLYYAESHDEQKRDTLFNLYDAMDAEAESQGNDGRRLMIRVNRFFVLDGSQQYDEIIRLSPEYLDMAQKAENWRIFYMLHGPQINADRHKGDSDKALEVAREMYEHAKERGNNAGMGIAFYFMSQIYSNQRRFVETEESLRESIRLMQDSVNVINLLLNAYASLSSSLTAQKRFDEAIQVNDDVVKHIFRYEEASRSKQPNAWVNLYLRYINVYRQTRQYEKTEIYMNKIDSITNHAFQLYEERASILAWRKRFDEALEMADKAIEAANPKDKTQPMGMKMMILLRKGDAEAAEIFFPEIISAMDESYNDRMNAQLDEIRTLHEVDKIEAEKERALMEKIRNRNYFLLASGGCILLAIALVIWIYYSRTIVRKNRRLFLQIEEHDRIEAALEAQLLKNSDPEPLPEDGGLEEKEENLELFYRKLTRLMKEKRLFTDVDIKRKDVASQIGLSDRGLHDCIKNCTKMSFMEYINTLRLSYSRELLSMSDERFTIDAIVCQSGFKSRSTFYRLFTEKYGLSPKQYKQITKVK
jgi:AraC-like DNA-binding protein